MVMTCVYKLNSCLNKRCFPEYQEKCMGKCCGDKTGYIANIFLLKLKFPVIKMYYSNSVPNVRYFT